MVAIISAAAVIGAAIIGIYPTFFRESPKTAPGPERPNNPTPSLSEGRLAGVLTDRDGKSISDMSVSIRNGPAAFTDVEGKFVLSKVPSGDQLLIIESPLKGQLTQNVRIEPKQTTSVNVVYDANTSRLGLLSITAPVDNSLLELRRDGNEHRAVIYGRCDGISQILDAFDIWVLIRSERDSRFWVQHPPAVIDPNSNTWRAKVLFGDKEHPPKDREHWDIVAVAAGSESQIGRVLNTPALNQLPSHITSNVITVETKIVR